ncbi:hypothetical protein VTL71DRAFT_15326 [Oculimacula yallundae]|uniref:Uncharacterized protein n=1 Tax=Oculimacula yallundae TaxID=86028 RepID=A0ABR4CGA2_9HELO
MIIFGLDSGTKIEIKQRDARDWLRRLEYAVIGEHAEEKQRDLYVTDGVTNVEAVNRDLVSCHAQVLVDSDAYLRVLESVEGATRELQRVLPDDARSRKVQSVFSTTFFNFQNAPDMTSSVISPRFWIYCVVTVPVTIVIVGLWYLWEQQRMKRYEMEDRNIERRAEHLERVIMAQIRKRTLE